MDTEEQRLEHFTIKPYADGLGLEEWLEQYSVPGTKYLVAQEGGCKNNHCHVQFYTQTPVSYMKKLLAELSKKHHVKRAYLEAKSAAEASGEKFEAPREVPIKRVGKGTVDEVGFRYMCKDKDGRTRVYLKRGFTDEEIDALFVAAEEHRKTFTEELEAFAVVALGDPVPTDEKEFQSSVNDTIFAHYGRKGRVLTKAMLVRKTRALTLKLHKELQGPDAAERYLKYLMEKVYKVYEEY